MKKYLVFIFLCFIALPPAAQADTTKQISQYGITWTFDKEYENGQFVNGDYWVVGPVTVVAIDPSPAEGRHGSMINPKSHNQPFDSRIAYYDAALGVMPPFILDKNKSLVSVISHTTTGEHMSIIGRSVWEAHSYLKTAAVLTCLAEAVPAGTFRPPFSGDVKPLYNFQNIRRDKLPNLSMAQGGVQFPGDGSLSYADQYAKYFQKIWLGIIGADWQARTFNPTDNMPNYYRESYGIEAEAAMMIVSDKVTDSLLINYLQHGIDNYYATKTAAIGSRELSKGPIMAAAYLLGAEEMMNVDDKFFREIREVYYADARSGWNGELVLWGRVKYEQTDPNEWNAVAVDAGCGCKQEAYRRDSHSWNWVGTALALHILDLKDKWGHNEYFDYLDRWMNEPDTKEQLLPICSQDQTSGGVNPQCTSYSSYPPSQTARSGLLNNMWNLYRANYGCVYTGADGLYRKYTCGDMELSCRNIISYSSYPDQRSRDYNPCGVSVKVLYGDVSGDGELGVYDAAMTAQAAVGSITLTAEQAQKADVSGEGEVGSYDAALIAQRAVGLISKFPVE